MSSLISRAWRGGLAVGALALVAIAPAALAAPIPGDIATPSPPPIAWPEGPGKVLVETRCLFCHHGELIASQRLTPAQWDKEVEKMMKWGAPLSAAEKKVLAGYLAKHFPVGAKASAAPSLRLLAP